MKINLLINVAPGARWVYWLLFLLLWQNAWQEQLKGRKDLFLSHSLRVQCFTAEKSGPPELEAARHMASAAARANCGIQLLSSFYSVGTQSMEGRHSH